jgi:hypothetical protein
MSRVDFNAYIEAPSAGETQESLDPSASSKELSRPVFVYSRRAELALSGMLTVGVEVERWG